MAPILQNITHGTDTRVYELTGKERVTPFGDGHVRFDITCPYHKDESHSCWVHFGLDGNGRFYCRPCGSVGVAEHDVDARGKRFLTLICEGEVDEGSW